MPNTSLQFNDFLLYLADNAHILGHRLGEWCGHGPILEQDIAITNIALDLVGQSRLYYQYLAEILNDGRSEDDLAFLRLEHQYLNALLVEQPNGDWGETIIRQFFFDAYHYPLLEQLGKCSDEHLSSIAQKSIKEVAYHLKYSSEWTIRLGDGTEESHERMQNAVNDLWMYTGELVDVHSREDELGKTLGIDWKYVRDRMESRINDVINMATLSLPENTVMQSGGKSGRHSEHLGYILAEMQYMQRAYPNSTW